MYVENEVTSTFLDSQAYIRLYRERTVVTVPGPRTPRWCKSTFSGGSGDGNCIEIALTSSEVSVRDAKNAGGKALNLTAGAWHSFLELVMI